MEWQTFATIKGRKRFFNLCQLICYRQPCDLRMVCEYCRILRWKHLTNLSTQRKKNNVLGAIFWGQKKTCFVVVCEDCHFNLWKLRRMLHCEFWKVFWLHAVKTYRWRYDLHANFKSIVMFCFSKQFKPKWSFINWVIINDIKYSG